MHLPFVNEEEEFSFEEIRGKYKATEKVGEGTFSSVFKATSINNPEKVVALKRIYPSSSPSRVFHEMQMLKILGYFFFPSHNNERREIALTANFSLFFFFVLTFHRGKAGVPPLLDVLRCRDQITIVIPYFEHDKFKVLLHHNPSRFFLPFFLTSIPSLLAFCSFLFFF